MIHQHSQLLIFNKHFTNFVRSYVHSILDEAEIPHFIHSITGFSVLVYIGLISHQVIALERLLSHPLVKSSKTGVDEDGDVWIELFF